MASVHLARREGDGGFVRTVAIKRLHPLLARDPELVNMLIDEARLTSRIRHINVASTLDVAVGDGEVFVVMEYVDGESLARILEAVRASGRAVPPPIAAAIAKGILSGLHAAHEATGEDGRLLGLVHRDVSPQNVLIGVDGIPRLVDFGIAKAAGRLQTTRKGEIKGKLSYMSPEQVRGREVDRRSDVFAASIVLWEMLSGRRLFDATTEAEAMIAILERPISAPSELGAFVSSDLETILLRGLSRDPDRRYDDARSMALAIDGATKTASEGQIAAWMMSMVGDAVRERSRRAEEIATAASAEGSAVVETSASERPPNAPVPGPTKRRARLVAVAALCVAASLFVFTLKGRRRSPAAETTHPATPSVTVATPTEEARETLPSSTDGKTDVVPVRDAARAHATTSPAKSPRPAGQTCTPPFTVDADGIRKWKAWCR